METLAAAPALTTLSLRILVIDDDEPTLKALYGVLGAHGHDPVVTSSGQAGIDEARRKRPDIILCDITMPGMDGYEVLRTLRRDLATATIPFIFLSGNRTQDFIRQGMGLGADDYLVKPFETKQLLESIGARIERQRIATQKLEHLRLSLTQSVPSEFFTPLNAILGFSMLTLDALRAGEELNRDDLEDSLEGIHQAGEHLLRIANNYVLFTQLSAEEHLNYPRTQPTAPEIWEPSLARVVRKLALQHGRMKDLHYSFAREPLAVKSEHLEKLAYELLDNALKFSRPGEWVAVTGLVSEGRYILRVTDHGRGMTPEQIRNSGALMQFDRHKIVQAGVGLGLQICRLLAHRQSGDLQIRCNTGEGVTVEVAFPLANDDDRR